MRPSSSRFRQSDDASPRLGYTIVEAERQGQIKTHLAVEPVEAETVRLIFRLYAEGDARIGTPPLGIKHGHLVQQPWLPGHQSQSHTASRGHRPDPSERTRQMRPLQRRDDAADRNLQYVSTPITHVQVCCASLLCKSAQKDQPRAMEIRSEWLSWMIWF
jgi:hypothetical protein